MFDVIIDIGHFGYESGAVAQGYREADLNKQICDKIIKILQKDYKLKVGVTTGSLSDRTKFENKNPAKMFVSVHCNAGGGTGFESWIYKTGYNAEKIASSINSELSNLGVKNRGIKVNPSFYVLKNTNAPAVLVECGFIDSSDIKYLTTRQEEIAKYISNGIVKYLGKDKKPSSNKKVITLEKGIDTIEIKLQQ